MKKPYVLPLVLSSVALTGCATITSDKTQPLTVQTICNGSSVENATCQLTNSKGVFIVQTPGTVSVHKAYGDMAIDCKKGDARGAITVQSSSTTNTWGNVIAGGVIGAVVDAKTGAGYEYSNSIVVPLQGTCPSG